MFDIGGKKQSIQQYIQNLDIFKNLKSMEKFGKFGNANIYNLRDWVNVNTKTNPDGIQWDTKEEKFVEYFKKLGTLTNPDKPAWDDKTKSCEFYSSVQIKVKYLKTGFEENL